MHACMKTLSLNVHIYKKKTFKCARAWTMNGEWNNFCMEIFFGLSWIGLYNVWGDYAGTGLVVYCSWVFFLYELGWVLRWRWWWMHDWDHVDDNNTFSYKVILEILHYFYLFLWNSTLIFILKEALTNHTIHIGPNWVIRLRIILYHCWEVNPIIILHCYKKVPFKGYLKNNFAYIWVTKQTRNGLG